MGVINDVYGSLMGGNPANIDYEKLAQQGITPTNSQLSTTSSNNTGSTGKSSTGRSSAAKAGVAAALIDSVGSLLGGASSFVSSITGKYAPGDTYIVQERENNVGKWILIGGGVLVLVVVVIVLATRK